MSNRAPLEPPNRGYLLSCDGISELVRGQEALFLTEFEAKIEILYPAQTHLVAGGDRPRCAFLS